jgi:hypothetical protein
MTVMDFTLEELQLIEWYFKKETAVPEIPYIHLQLLSKIQRMINNYCDHDGAAGEVETFADTCPKCNIFMLNWLLEAIVHKDSWLNNATPTKWLKRICEHWKDKKLAEKCGLEVKDICVHESDGNTYMTFQPYSFPGKYRCKKCGHFWGICNA